MNDINLTHKNIPENTSLVNNDQYSVIGGHVGNDLDAEELDLYRFMLGGLLAK